MREDFGVHGWKTLLDGLGAVVTSFLTHLLYFLIFPTSISLVISYLNSLLFHQSCAFGVQSPVHKLGMHMHTFFRSELLYGDAMHSEKAVNGRNRRKYRLFFIFFFS